MGERTARRVRLPLLVTVVAAALVLVAASCSSSSSNGKTSGTTAGTTAGTSAGAASSTPAASGTKVKSNDKLGKILANSKGQTLYTLTRNGKAVPCDAACQKVWPPAKAPGGAQLMSGGLPLYTYAQDEDAEDAYGEGIDSFGGVWHVVKAGPGNGAGAGAGAGGSTPSTESSSTTSTMSGGGGY